MSAGHMVRVGVIAVVLAMSGCASGGEGVLRAEGPKGYVVEGGSAIYAGSMLPEDDTRGGLDSLYFGQYIVRSMGTRGGFSSDVGADSHARPEGAVVAVWAALEKTDEWVHDERPGFSYRKETNHRYYYAAALPSQISPYPEKSVGHEYYGIYVSAGRTVVSPAGLRPEDAPHATEFITGRARRKNYVFGREDTIYYKILSRAPGSTGAEDDPSPWHILPGVALTEAQYLEMLMCNADTLSDPNGKPCRAFLDSSDPDLTPEQREYVRQHPITRKDIAPLIRRLKKAARISNRWA